MHLQLALGWIARPRRSGHGDESSVLSSRLGQTRCDCYLVVGAKRDPGWRPVEDPQTNPMIHRGIRSPDLIHRDSCPNDEWDFGNAPVFGLCQGFDVPT